MGTAHSPFVQARRGAPLKPAQGAKYPTYIEPAYWLSLDTCAPVPLLDWPDQI